MRVRADFERERQSGIGSSDMPAILGISPWRSAVDVYLEKIGEKPASPVSAAMRVGLKLEPVIASEYTELTDNTLNDKETFFRHPDHDWFITHPDRFVVAADLRMKSGVKFSRLVELKSIGPYMADQWGDPGTDEVPESYLVQVQHQLKIVNELFGIEYADIAAFFRGPAETKIYTVKYDPELGQLMLDRAMKFWFEHVLKKQPPAMDGSVAATELLKRKFPRAGVFEIEATPAVENMVNTLRADYLSQAALNTAVAKAEQEIKFVMGTAAVLSIGKERITWKQDRPGTKVDHKSIHKALAQLVAKEDYEQILATFTEDKEGPRRFLVPRNWKREVE